MSLTNKELAKKIDDLPDKLIERLDDRYYKKEDVDNKFLLYVKKETVVIVTSVVSFMIFVLGAIGGFIVNLWLNLNGGK